MMVPRGKMLAVPPGSTTWPTSVGTRATFDAWAARRCRGLELRRGPALLQEERGTRAQDDLSSTPTPTKPKVRSVLPCGADHARVLGRSWTPRSLRHSRPATTTGEIGATQTGSLAACRPRPTTGKRSSTYHAFLEGNVEQRPNLMMITGAQVTRIVLEGEPGALRATGIEYVDSDGASQVVTAGTEVIVSAGAVGSPQLLMLSGIGPASELESLGVACRSTLRMSASTSRITSSWG